MIVLTDPSSPLSCVQSKFELITGIASDDQALSLLRADEGELVAKMDDPNRSLGSYGVVGQYKLSGLVVSLTHDEAMD